MGAINYKTSEIVTLGSIPIEWEDFKDDVEDWTEDDPDYELISDYERDEFINAQEIIDKYYFVFFNVSLEGGYYAGYFLNLEEKYSYFDYLEDKKAAIEEIDKLKELLIELIDNSSLVVYYPGWIESHEDYQGSLDVIEREIDTLKKRYQQMTTLDTEEDDLLTKEEGREETEKTA